MEGKLLAKVSEDPGFKQPADQAQQDRLTSYFKGYGTGSYAPETVVARGFVGNVHVRTVRVANGLLLNILAIFEGTDPVLDDDGNPTDRTRTNWSVVGYWRFEANDIVEAKAHLKDLVSEMTSVLDTEIFGAPTTEWDPAVTALDEDAW